ncbi:hypothetical protein [Cupriavidus malaysiensis]|uniref:hypothetical protein n=1 Tax=Cupriavidus malaysiensis TaxID=367825 RepID=UPI0012FF74BC|nr:hypothetical protein [Cupriavidus malaysiensis]
MSFKAGISLRGSRGARRHRQHSIPAHAQPSYQACAMVGLRAPALPMPDREQHKEPKLDGISQRPGACARQHPCPDRMPMRPLILACLAVSAGWILTPAAAILARHQAGPWPAIAAMLGLLTLLGSGWLVVRLLRTGAPPPLSADERALLAAALRLPDVLRQVDGRLVNDHGKRGREAAEQALVELVRLAQQARDGASERAAR